MNGKSILLHCCCAPCAGHVQNLLGGEYEVVSFFYNPNIHPRREYEKRLDELRRFSRKKAFRLIEGEYDAGEWFRRVKERRFEGERSGRCRLCIAMRLERSFAKAAEESIGLVGTTLSISPHKDASMINELGRGLSARYGIGFFEADFKKNDGFRKSLDISRAEGFYRQNYCGCVYSRHSLYNPRHGGKPIGSADASPNHVSKNVR